VVALTKIVRSTNRPATASLHSATPKEKHSLHFCFGGGEFFLEKGKGVFLSGFCPPSIRAVGGAKCGLGFAKTIFWGKGFGKTSADFVFAFCPRGGGVWGGIRAG